MFRNLLKVVIFETLLCVLIIMITKDDFRFHFYEDVLLTKKMATSPDEVPKNVSYRINPNMRYRFNLQSEDGLTKSTLLWPEEAFSQILIFVPYQSKELNDPQKHVGRLIPCEENCRAQNIGINIKEITDQLVQKFPEYKGKLTQLPATILDTTQTPNGLIGYFIDTNKYWLAFLISLIFSGIYLMIETVVSRRSKV